MAEITFPGFWIWPEITPKNTKSDNGRGGGYKTTIPGYTSGRPTETTQVNFVLRASQFANTLKYGF